jgi:tRNA (guanine37-N1)-methyltransferase
VVEDFEFVACETMKADIVTIFPDFFRGPLDHGITRRACEMGLAKIEVHDLRAFTHDKHRTVDDRPFGGGEGMVLKPEPIFECLETLGLAPREQRLDGAAKQSVILLSAQGQRFRQKVATELATLDRVVLICGRYEGVDERIAAFLADRELSIGDYVLSGGELAAAVVIESITRLLPGAVGNEASTRQESFTPQAMGAEGDEVLKNDSTCGSNGLLDYPHYTRPADFRGMAVPEVLINGNHKEIRSWRREQALKKTLRNRPELLDVAELSEEDANILGRIRRMTNDQGPATNDQRLITRDSRRRTKEHVKPHHRKTSGQNQTQ